jgi:hypothetical protein
MIYGGMLWTAVTYLPSLVTVSYFCAPHSGKSWTLKVSNECAKTYQWDLTSAALSITLDLFLLILPISQLIKLQLSAPRKWGIVAVYFVATG